jgi:hypothetical protein
MDKSKVAETGLSVNPVVSITYNPEKQVLALGNRALEVLGKLQGTKITSPKTLEAATEIFLSADAVLTEIGEVRDALANRVKEAFEPYKRFPLFEGSEINITMKIPARQRLDDAYRASKSSRAQYLAAEDERIRRENLAKQAEQDRINREAAQKAAAEAKKQGADRSTIAEIKQAVLETPAPIVTSKAAEVAQAANVTLRYNYYASVTDLKKFLGLCLQNESFFNTLKSAVPDIEAAFRTTANTQKEAFNYPGITFRKVPVDVGRRQ